MDQLFIDLKLAIYHFLDIGEKSFTKLSDLGEEDLADGYLPGCKKFWRKVLTEASNYYQAYIDFLAQSENQPEMDLDMLDMKIAFFRSVGRWISECPPEWSAYYPDIDERLNRMYLATVPIDKKYQIGWHKPKSKLI